MLNMTALILWSVYMEEFGPRKLIFGAVIIANRERKITILFHKQDDASCPNKNNRNAEK